MRNWVVIGAPTSAGAHHAGQELAPPRCAPPGLLGRLREAGLAVSDGGVPLVLGGDCTITLGVVAAFGPDVRLVYLDGDMDLGPLGNADAPDPGPWTRRESATRSAPARLSSPGWPAHRR